MNGYLLQKDKPLLSSTIQRFWHPLLKNGDLTLQEIQSEPESEMRREPQNSSTPVPRFQREAGLLNHTGGIYSHSGMIDYPRFPISEWHLGKIHDSMEFQSWKVNFKTEVCSKSADAHLSMQQIKEVDMTSQSIAGRRNFLDCDILDAMIASALGRLLDKHFHIRKRVRVEEQRAQKYDRFLRRRQFAYMIHEHFRHNYAENV